MLKYNKYYKLRIRNITFQIYQQLIPAMWSAELESIARNIRNQANGYSWIYERIVSKAQRCENVLSILTGVFSAILGTGGLIATFEYEYGWIGITTAVIGFINSILSVLNATWNFGVIKTEGIISQTDFSNLSHDITLQLALDPIDRIDGKEFITKIMKDIDDIILNAPTIDNDVKNQYIQQFKNNPIYNPEGQNRPHLNVPRRSMENQTPNNQELKNIREAKIYRRQQREQREQNNKVAHLDDSSSDDEHKTASPWRVDTLHSDSSSRITSENIQRRKNIQDDKISDDTMVSNWESSQ